MKYMKRVSIMAMSFFASVILIALYIMVSPAFCQDAKRVILLETMPVPVVLKHSEWFVKQMNELGYIQGDNMDLVVLKADGDRNKAETVLKKAVGKQKPDIVVTNATLASQTAKKILEKTNIPIVFMTVSDPVGAGLISKIGVPTKTNITGKVHMIDRETRINMVMRLIRPAYKKKPVRIGFIHSSYPSSVGDLRDLSEVSKKRDDVIFLSYEVRYRKVPEGLPGMLEDTIEGIEALNDNVDCWWEPSGPLGEVAEYSHLLLTHSSHPIVMGTKLKSVELGALLHLTPKIETSGRETAIMVDAILKGAHPGNLPPLPPSDFDIGINLKNSLKHNIVIPPDLLKLAGKQIYR
jgi:putative tryptophan/tyrosine transport system substrate-binding protein